MALREVPVTPWSPRDNHVHLAIAKVTLLKANSLTVSKTDQICTVLPFNLATPALHVAQEARG